MAIGEDGWEEKIAVPTPIANDNLQAPGHALCAWQFAKENKLRRYPQQFESICIFAIKSAYCEFVPQTSNAITMCQVICCTSTTYGHPRAAYLVLRVVGSGNIHRALLSLAIMLCMWTKQVTLLCILRWHFERHNTQQDIFPCLRIGSGAGKDPAPAFAAMSTSPARRATGSGAGASSPTSPTESSPFVKGSFVPRFDNTISGYKEGPTVCT